MPVLANQKAVEQFYEYPIRQAAGWTVFETVTSSIHQSLHLFRTHHQKCAARRKHALSHELRQETQRTEWLKRKYLDTVRQQQQAISARVDSTNNTSSRGFEVMDPGSEQQEQLSTTKLSCNKSVDSPPHNMETNCKMIHTDADILIKKEPESDDNLSSPSKMGPELTPFNTTTETLGLELKRRLSQTAAKPDMSRWGSLNGSEDRDELKLTAYDVIAGVISTPPIEPLEQDADTHVAPHSGVSPPSSSSSSPITPATSTITSTTSSTALPSSTVNNKQTLDRDLDEFSKVYDQVTQEQKAKERRHSLASELEPPVYRRQRPTHLLDPPPYIAMSQRCPPAPQLSAQNNYYRHKYIQLQTPPPSQSQVDCVYQPKNIKPQLILPSACSALADSPTSTANHIPATPTTPLEHFSSFQSSSPHVALAPPHNQSTPGPPPPYSSTALGYSYSHEPVHQTPASSSSKRWPHPHQPLHPVLPEQAQQEKPKETIMAHVSSHVVSLAGQKRPIQEFNGSVLPPAKVQSPPIGLPNSLHGYHHSSGLPLAPPYPGPSAPAPSFPHRPL